MATQFKLTETDFETGITSHRDLTADEIAAFDFSGESVILANKTKLINDTKSAIEKLQSLGLTLDEALAITNNG
jgi:hypothetical protein